MIMWWYDLMNKRMNPSNILFKITIIVVSLFRGNDVKYCILIILILNKIFNGFISLFMKSCRHTIIYNKIQTNINGFFVLVGYIITITFLDSFANCNHKELKINKEKIRLQTVTDHY